MRNTLKFLVPVLFVALIVAETPAFATQVGTSRKFGLGGILGAPTGVTGKVFFDRQHALDFAFGIGWLSGSNLHIHVDYLFHFQVAKTRHFDLPMYVGVGGRFNFWFSEGYHGYWGPKDHDHYSQVGLGVRVPVGVAFHLNKVPLDPFFEIAPAVGFLPVPGFTIDAAIGVRYYF